MLTNIFRVGGLQQISWFQLLPAEVDTVQQIETSKSSSIHLDFAANKVLTAHIQLQNEGHLSSWSRDSTGSVEDVLPGSPFTGDIIKLWLFLPGQHESISTSVQSAISGLKVVGTGLWCLPGDSDEVASALSQALRNRIERALRGVGYIRFGDVFVKCRSLGPSETQLRKPLPTCEVVFAASEEAIFVHFVVQRKRVRTLSVNDMQAALRLHGNMSATLEDRLSVVVSPNGLSGWLTGCYSGDLVNELYQSKLKAANDQLATGRPLHMISSSHHGKNTGLYAEVYLGQFTNVNATLPQVTAGTNIRQKKTLDQGFGKGMMSCSEREEGVYLKENICVERMLIYPTEAVLVSCTPVIPARTYLKRCWLQSWVGTTWLEDDPHVGLAVASSASSWRGVNKAFNVERPDKLTAGTNGLQERKSCSSKSSSSSSSGGSSIKCSSSQGSSSSSGSDVELGIGSSELEADAESIVSKANILAGTDPSKQAMHSLGHPTEDGFDEMKGFEDLVASVKRGIPPESISQSEVTVAKVARRNNNSGGELSNDALKSVYSHAEVSVLGLGVSSNIGVGTPKAAGSQVGTPWDWPEDDRGLSMDIQIDADILAEFGDFGDFFEKDELGFGEPPGTAEYQALMLSLADCGELVTSPAIGRFDLSDPMLLPILDIPALEGFGQQNVSVQDEKIQGNRFPPKDSHLTIKSPALPPAETPFSEASSVSKLEAMVLFAPGYDPVSIPNGQVSFQNSGIFKSPYIPESRKVEVDGLASESYVYSATPPPSPKSEEIEKKREHYESMSDKEQRIFKRMKESDGKNDVATYMKTKSYSVLQGSKGKAAVEKSILTGGKASRINEFRNSAWSGLSSFKTGQSIYVQEKGKLYAYMLGRSTTMLATDLESHMLQLAMIRLRDVYLWRNPGPQGWSKATLELVKDRVSDGMQTTDPSTFGKVSTKQQQERKKKDRIPSRIAGDIDEEVHDGPRVSQVGVWRPVGTPKPQKVPDTFWSDSARSNSIMTSPDVGNTLTEETLRSSMKQNQLQELLDAIPLLVQQGSVSFDIAFDGDCGDGPFGWLISQEQQRRQSVCGPGMSHAGCGGMLAASHFLDNSGVELLDPFFAEVSAASVAAILQSDLRMGMSTAFVDASLDGPLSVADWCRGHVLPGDGLVGDSLPSDSKETVSTVTGAVGEPITPPQCTAVGTPGLKVSGQDVESQVCDAQRSSSSWAMEGSSLSDDGCTRRTGQDTGFSDVDSQWGNSRFGPTIIVLPTPSLLVGYQDDWLKTSSSTLHLWEKAPLEPYALAKAVTYYVVCPRIDALLSAAADYIQQLGTVYEACRLGTHAPAGMVGGQAASISSSCKRTLSGFVTVDFPSQSSQTSVCFNPVGSMSDYFTTVSKMWNLGDFRKALRKVCKTLPVCASPAIQRDPENGPCLVYYVICPSSEPLAVLQTMIDACQCIGSNVGISDKERRTALFGQIQKFLNGTGSPEDNGSISVPGIVGFPTPKLVLQVLTAATIFKASSPVALEVDALKEVAFTVYNKVRRIPRSTPVIIDSTQVSQPGRARLVASSHTSLAMPGMWKDCGTSRSSGANSPLLSQDSLLETSSYRANNWDNAWQQSATVNDNNSTSVADGQAYQSVTRYLFEPAFILAEPGAPDQGMGMSSIRTIGLEEPLGGGQVDAMQNTGGEGPEFDITSGGTQRVANFHCSYGWTEDWQWLISVWTDARGELLDVHLFPMIGVIGRWDTRGLHSLFVQVLQHGCQLLSMNIGTGNGRPRNMVISRIGAFYELEYQEWQKAISTVGGGELKKWPVQIWHQSSESSIVGGNTSSLQPQDMATFADRALGLASSGPSSPGPSSSVFSPRSKASSFVKSELGSNATRKQGAGSLLQVESCKGAFQWVQSITFVNVFAEHSLQLVGPADMASYSGGTQSVLSSTGWLGQNNVNTYTSLGTGAGVVKTLASTSVSYLVIPAHGLHFIPSLPLQLPPYITPETPPIAQFLQKKGFATAVASAFVVSKATPSIRSEFTQQSLKEWPSTLYIGLVGHMGMSTNVNTQQGPGRAGAIDMGSKIKASRSLQIESRDQAADAHCVLEAVAAELQALSWLTVSPTFPIRRTALPFHCDVVQRLRRLLQYANNELGGLQEQQVC